MSSELAYYADPPSVALAQKTHTLAVALVRISTKGLQVAQLELENAGLKTLVAERDRQLMKERYRITHLIKTIEGGS